MARKSDILWKVAAGGAAAFWLTQGVRWLRGMRRLPVLAPAPCDTFHDLDTRVAIIVPARNEEESVSAAVSSLLAHAPDDAVLVAVDDRSTDGTGAALDRLAGENPRLRVLHLTDLPAGWLGKNHAIMTGTRAARQIWEEQGRTTDDGFFLFTDADVVYAPGGIAAALRYAGERALDHLTLFPILDTRGFWEKTFTSAFMFLFGWRFGAWTVNDPRSKSYIGIGAFNLVRASAYDRMGGHEALRLDVADDVRLGREMRASGGRQEIANGTRLLSLRWQQGLRGLVLGMEKNGFAGVDYSVSRLFFSTIGMLLLASPFPGVFATRGAARAANAASLAMVAAVYHQGEEMGGASWPYFLTYPLGTALFLFSLWRSAALTLLRGGVAWRDTFYSLDELRTGLPSGKPGDSTKGAA
jgi:glycosyltransferase involved in cell wall biosynthesis